ncbi:hypothetical protein H4R24_003289 [Coemansia sp. RSA 988]|nr:hypothetical protein H4R24_003289 [Coemansia sp. RSA 988]
MKIHRILIGVGALGGLATSRPIYKEIAHSIGYDAIVASNAGTAVGDGIRGLINALGSLDVFKPIIHPGAVSTINTLETFGGLISTLAGFATKLAVKNAFNSNLLNDTPYIGELIRQADAMIKPEYKDALESLASEAMVIETVSQYS